MKAMVFNAMGHDGTDCPLCFRSRSLRGPRTERATLECSGCFARFIFFRGVDGAPDTLKRVLLPSVWPLVLVLVAFLGGCAGPEPIRGTGERIEPPSGWLEYCQHEPSDPSCKAPSP